MSIFSSIMSKIFNRGGEAQAAAAPSGQMQAPAPSGVAAAATPGGGSGAGNVDVEAVLTELAGKAAQELDWRRSIADLMKLLDLDSSLSARKQLATELHYTGDTNDSGSMNVWLHKQVMKKLAENGGKVPDDLRN
jgi:hypothetical protein